ncbi:MAG: hypothetical protein IJ565_02965 [Bacilli bacterium]|nr:hypothetical protein [Bacilli bacterium]
MKDYKMYDENYVCEIIENGLKNTPYENDMNTFNEIFNNVFTDYLELMINNVKTTYDELIKKELLRLGIA